MRSTCAYRYGGIPESVVYGETDFLMERDVERFGRQMSALPRDVDGTEAAAHRPPTLVRERWTWDRSISALEQLCAETAATAHVHAGGHGGSTRAS
jgi:hypothetical protein